MLLVFSCCNPRVCELDKAAIAVEGVKIESKGAAIKGKLILNRNVRFIFFTSGFCPRQSYATIAFEFVSIR
jgi:hypothetical protein